MREVSRGQRYPPLAPRTPTSLDGLPGTTPDRLGFERVLTTPNPGLTSPYHLGPELAQTREPVSGGRMSGVKGVDNFLNVIRYLYQHLGYRYLSESFEVDAPTFLSLSRRATLGSRRCSVDPLGSVH